MTNRHRQRTGPGALAFLLLSLASTPGAMAQYKVVGPDGKVTYTDRPAPAAGGAPAPLSSAPGSVSTATPAANLPLALRQPVARFPVVLYAQSGCDACEAGRQFLRQRGIPFTEKLVGNEDGEALQRATGGRAVPALTVGQQVLSGFSSGNWSSYLDAAGYPRQSALPANYVAPAPSPLVPPRPSRAEGVDPAPGTAPPAPVAPPAPGPGGIRF
jgi:glutaredoxin